MEQINKNIHPKQDDDKQEDFIKQNGLVYNHYDVKLKDTDYLTNKEKLDYLSKLIQEADENLLNNLDALARKDDRFQR